MKLSLGSIFRVSIRYVYQRGDTYYYQRKIPLDLLERYGGTQLIKVNLKTADLRQVAKQVSALNKQYESIWASLRTDHSLKPLSVNQAAIKLLARYALAPRPTTNEELNWTSPDKTDTFDRWTFPGTVDTPWPHNEAHPAI